jgi:hypothetical protein
LENLLQDLVVEHVDTLQALHVEMEALHASASVEVKK